MHSRIFAANPVEMTRTESVPELQKIAAQIRRDAVRMVYAVQSGHPGGSLGCADFFAAMYFSIMKHTPERFAMAGHGEDLFFLSNGHISPGWYSTLARAGYFDIAELATFRKINSRLQGHPATKENLPGIRLATGSLGQGMSVAIGAALAKKLNTDSSLVYSLHGDGELQEGQNWEAATFAAHHKVDNLIATIDLNGQQIDGSTKTVMNIGDVGAKFRAFGWHTMNMDGHDMNAILSTMKAAREASGKGKPVCIVMKTEMGKGVDYMEGTHEFHGKAPNESQFHSAMAQLPATLGDY